MVWALCVNKDFNKQPQYVPFKIQTQKALTLCFLTDCKFHGQFKVVLLECSGMHTQIF